MGEGREDHRSVLKIEVGGGSPSGGCTPPAHSRRADRLYKVVLWPQQSLGWRKLLITANALGLHPSAASAPHAAGNQPETVPWEPCRATERQDLMP